MGQRDQRLDVDAYLSDLALEAAGGERAVGAEAGVVHQQVHFEAAFRDPRRKRADRVRRLKVCHLHLGTHGKRAKLCGECVQALATAGDQHEVVAAGGELAGELLPDPRRGARDQGGAVVTRGREGHGL